MKKIKYIRLFILACIFTSLFSVSNVKAASGYEVATLSSDGTKTTIGTYANYEDAYNKMNEQQTSANKTAVIYNPSGRMINCTECIAKTNATDALYLTLYKDGYKYDTILTAISTDDGTDSVFLEYYHYMGTPTTKIKISAARGWVDYTDVDLVPVSLLNKNRTSLLITATTSINFRTEPSTQTSEVIGFVSKGETYACYDTKVAEGFTWYKISKGGKYGWIASQGDDWVKPTTTNSNINTYYYINSNNEVVHTYETDNYGQVNLTIGTNPGYLKQNTRYYSFDGNYFYTDIYTLIRDEKGNNHNNALNKDKPYYAYYVYLPLHSKTGYSAGNLDNIIKQMGYTSSTSKLYGLGYAFIDAQNKYGVNALQAFSKATSESAYGTSKIAQDKNNLFGMGADDDNPYGNATKYNSPYDSVMDYARTIGQNGYTNPSDWRYNGGSYGNKLMGLNVRYATDPYWGEKQAASSFYYDKLFGSVDVNSYTLGIKQGNKVINVYKKNSTSSGVIYQTKNSSNGYKTTSEVYDTTFIITDKKDGFYKVYTDPPLDSNQNVNANLDYSFDNSYGWVKESDLYVENTQPTLEVPSTIEINEGEEFNINSYAKASDVEDKAKNKQVKITVSGTVDTSTVGEYKLTVIATDSQNFSNSKEVTVKVKPTNAPKLQFDDIEVSQYTEFDYLKGVEIPNQPELLSKVIHSNNVNTSILGEYLVTYKVTNSAGLKDEKTRTVTVVKNKNPELNVSNKTITLGETFDYKSGISATDFEDGNLTDKITYTGTVDTSKVGEYNVTYKVKDSANNEVSKTIKVTVEEIKYEDKQGVFYLNGLKYNQTSKKLEFSGFLTIKGINNVANSNTKFDVIFINQDTNEEIILPLERWLDNVPFTAPSDKGFDYSASWFKGNIELESIPKGNYTIYVRSRISTYQTKMEVTNSFFSKEITNKINQNGRGYLLQTNYTTRSMRIELFVRDYELIGANEKPTIDNMYNQVYSIGFNNNALAIKGTSHNVNGNYSAKQNVERTIYIENIQTKEIVLTKDVGSITNGPYVVSLKVSDGLDKTRAWFDTKIDISTLERGKYVIYVRTKTGSIDDYGELSDTLFQKLDTTTVINGKTYKISRNDNARYRIELTVE